MSGTDDLFSQDFAAHSGCPAVAGSASSKPEEIYAYHWLTLTDRKAMKDGLESMEKSGWKEVGPVYKCGGHYAQPLIRLKLVYSTRADETLPLGEERMSEAQRSSPSSPGGDSSPQNAERTDRATEES